jgi:hypothetical protein
MIPVMDKRTKREIRLLVQGVRDPRRGIGTLRGSLQRVIPVVAEGELIGLGLLLLISFPVSIPLAIIGSKVAGFWGLIVGAGLGVLVFLLWAYWSFFTEKGVRRVGSEHGYMLCVWCRHPISDLPKRGCCSKCAKGFDRNVSQALFKAHYSPPSHLPSDKVLKRQTSRLWARAIRERDRVRNPGSGCGSHPSRAS